MFITSYRCDLCGFRAAAIKFKMGYYRFVDGYEMHALTDPAWCNVCNDITSVEMLQPMEEVEKEIDRLRQRAFSDWDIECAEMLHESVDEFAAQRIELLMTHQRRFVNRTIANRCIECGFSDFRTLISLAQSGTLLEALLHVKCGGILRQLEVSHAIPATFFVLDADGNRVPAGKTT